RRFKVALRDWAEHADFEHVSLRPIAGSGSFDAFELRIVDKGQTGEETRAVRWHIEEQRDLDTNPRTRPDFLLRRMDDRGPEVAIYLDGYQFHATEQGYRLDDDATKRAAVRASGRLVWNLTWEDVEHFHKAMTAEIRHDPPPRPLLTGAARATAQQAHLRRGSWFDADVMHGNPMALLLDYLAHPV